MAAAADNALSLLVAQDAAQREKLWAARREMSHAVRRLAKNKLSEDVVVPRQKIPDLLDRVREDLRALGRAASSPTATPATATCTSTSSGNDDDEMAAVERAIAELFRDTIELGGTLSGEHGIGVLKAPYLGLEQSSELIALQRDIKRVFDPQGLLNPGKIFPSGGHRAC